MFLLNETGTATVGTLLESAATVITNILNFLETAATSLLANPIFQVMIGIVLSYIVFGLVFKLVRKMRKGGK